MNSLTITEVDWEISLGPLFESVVVPLLENRESLLTQVQLGPPKEFIVVLRCLSLENLLWQSPVFILEQAMAHPLWQIPAPHLKLILISNPSWILLYPILQTQHFHLLLILVIHLLLILISLLSLILVNHPIQNLVYPFFQMLIFIRLLWQIYYLWLIQVDHLLLKNVCLNLLIQVNPTKLFLSCFLL